MPEDKKIEPILPEISPQPVVIEKGGEEEKPREKEEAPVQGEEARETFVVVPSPRKQAPILQKKPSNIPAKSEELYVIERVLEEGLEDMYWQLPPHVKVKFKRRGEETAKKIERLVREVRLNIAKVLRLIRKWLTVIPHVNRFFLEQEAKIKTDKIVALHQERSKKT